jgi:SAM-dependent methyltransferase
MSENVLDPFGKAFMACYRGEKVSLIIRRDDGLVNEDDMEGYFKGHEEWFEVDRKALQWAQGRVLDVGCGPGRHLLWLQEKGFTVTGIDVSPTAVEVARLRGARDCRVMDVKNLEFPAGSFETVIMMGNNFGLAGGMEPTKKVLRDLHRITTDEGRIIATSRDPLDTEDPRHLAYHERNRRRGRPPGLVIIQLEFRGEIGPWFELFMATPEEMIEIAEATGWRVEETYREEDRRWRGLYAALLVKKN